MTDANKLAESLRDMRRNARHAYVSARPGACHSITMDSTRLGDLTDAADLIERQAAELEQIREQIDACTPHLRERLDGTLESPADMLVMREREVLGLLGRLSESQMRGDELRAKQVVPISDERIDAIADLVIKGMPDGIRGFMRGWGWQHFARELLDVCAGHYRAHDQSTSYKQDGADDPHLSARFEVTR